MNTSSVINLWVSNLNETIDTTSKYTKGRHLNAEIISTDSIVRIKFFKTTEPFLDTITSIDSSLSISAEEISKDQDLLYHYFTEIDIFDNIDTMDYYNQDGPRYITAFIWDQNNNLISKVTDYVILDRTPPNFIVKQTAESSESEELIEIKWEEVTDRTIQNNKNSGLYAYQLYRRSATGDELEPGLTIDDFEPVELIDKYNKDYYVFPNDSSLFFYKDSDISSGRYYNYLIVPIDSANNHQEESNFLSVNTINFHEFEPCAVKLFPQYSTSDNFKITLSSLDPLTDSAQILLYTGEKELGSSEWFVNQPQVLFSPSIDFKNGVSVYIKTAFKNQYDMDTLDQFYNADSLNESFSAKENQVIIDDQAPATIEDVEFTRVGTNSVFLKWKRIYDELSGIDGYKIYYARDALINDIDSENSDFIGQTDSMVINLSNDISIVYDTITFKPSQVSLDAFNFLKIAAIDQVGNINFESNVIDVSGNQSLSKESTKIPQEFMLYPAYPNPFNPQCNITFDIPGSFEGLVTLKIYNINGRTITTLINKTLDAGHYSVVWNGKDNNGKMCPTGIYFYQINAKGQFNKSNKMILLK